MTENEAQQIRELLYGVVQWGTASELSYLPYNIAGKTGIISCRLENVVYQ